MRLSEIEKKARSLGMKDTWKYSKKDLIKMIQRAEGNNSCFQTIRMASDCPQLACCWRPDCVR